MNKDNDNKAALTRHAGVHWLKNIPCPHRLSSSSHFRQDERQPARTRTCVVQPVRKPPAPSIFVVWPSFSPIPLQEDHLNWEAHGVSLFKAASKPRQLGAWQFFRHRWLTALWATQPSSPMLQYKWCASRVRECPAVLLFV